MRISVNRRKSASNKNKDSKETMSFWEHLEDLRRFLIRAIIVIALFFVIIFINKDVFFTKIILAPKETWFFTNAFLCRMSETLSIKVICINAVPLKLINIQIAGQFTAHILVSLIGAMVLSFPFILWQLWIFAKPALYAEEIKKVKGFIAICSFLFFTGVLFAYFIIIPLALNFLGTYQVSPSVENTISLMSYISTVSLISLAMGLVFQLPVLVFFLTRIGLLTISLLKKNRKIVFVIILILSAIITPPDVFSQLLVAFPLYVLYEISILICKKTDEKNIAQSTSNVI